MTAFILYQDETVSAKAELLPGAKRDIEHRLAVVDLLNWPTGHDRIGLDDLPPDAGKIDALLTRAISGVEQSP